MDASTRVAAMVTPGTSTDIPQASSVAWVSLLMSSLLAMLALTVVFSTLYIFRSWSMWISGVSKLTPLRALPPEFIVRQNLRHDMHEQTSSFSAITNPLAGQPDTHRAGSWGWWSRPSTTISPS